jgi:ABC-2 type transport system ATP-binding protein
MSPPEPLPLSRVPPGPDTGAVELRGVTRSFGAVQALRGIDLDIPAASTVALLGPNGAGKSTAIGILLGLLRADAGTTRILGSTPREAVAAGRVGAMLQTASLPQGARVDELITFARDLYPDPMPMDAIVRHAGLASLLRRTVDGLSGGESQRVRFGLAIAGDPDLVFLDEPTVGMDVESRRAFWDTMRGFASLGRTILFATHYLDEADQAADRIVILAEGRVVAAGTPSELKTLAGGRVIHCRLPGADTAMLERLPGVSRVQVDHERVTIHSEDPDRTLRSLLAAAPAASEIEVQAPRLDDAFLALTGGTGLGAPPTGVAA